MGFTETITFYLLFGGGVAVAVLLADTQPAPGQRAIRCALAVPFWPLFLPLVLKPAATEHVGPSARRSPAAAATDDLAAIIDHTEQELDAALGSLDGWAEHVLSAETDRFAELRAAWRAQAERIRQLDDVLERSGLANQPQPRGAGNASASSGTPADDRQQQCEIARLENIRRLHEVRDRLHGDLLGTLAWVRELVTQIHLARFTGAPASRAEELIAQIAAAVEGLSEASRLVGSA